MMDMPKAKPLFFSVLCLLCLSSMVLFSTAKSQIWFSNVNSNGGNITEPFWNDWLSDTACNIWNVTFVESGLPSGTQWEAILNGTRHFSTNVAINFDNLSVSTYLWSIPNAVAPNSYEGNGTVYSAAPPTGGMSICPYFLNIEQQIPFYPVSTSSPGSSPTPTPTPIVPELSWLMIIPLVVFMLSSAMMLRHRKVVKKVQLVTVSQIKQHCSSMGLRSKLTSSI
jgi:hypothetical protein